MVSSRCGTKSLQSKNGDWTVNAGVAKISPTSVNNPPGSPARAAWMALTKAATAGELEDSTMGAAGTLLVQAVRPSSCAAQAAGLGLLTRKRRGWYWC